MCAWLQRWLAAPPLAAAGWLPRTPCLRCRSRPKCVASLGMPPAWRLALPTMYMLLVSAAMNLTAPSAICPNSISNSERGWSSLLLAAARQHLPCLKAALRARPPGIMLDEETTTDGWNVLHLAADLGPPAQVAATLPYFDERALLAQHALGDSALHIVARRGNIRIASQILHHCGAEPMSKNVLVELLALRNNDGETALHLAARHGHAPLVRLLLQASSLLQTHGSADLPPPSQSDHGSAALRPSSMRDRLGGTPLHSLAGRRRHDAMSALITELDGSPTTHFPMSNANCCVVYFCRVVQVRSSVCF